MHMLWAEAHADQARWNAPQERYVIEEPCRERRAWLLRHRKHIADDAVLHEELGGLRHLGRPLPAGLHLAQRRERHGAFSQGFGKDVGGGHGVLDGEIDADAADRRHGMRRISDAEKAFAAPFLQPVHPHREELHVVPGRDLADAVGELRIEVDDLRAEGRQPLFAQRVVAALRDHESALPVVAAVEHDEEMPGLDTAKGLRSVLGALGQAHPEHVHRRPKFFDFKSC